MSPQLKHDGRVSRDAPPLLLRAHGLLATFAPAGATVTRLARERAEGAVDLLRPAPDGAHADTSEPPRFGLWPMIPFANRAFPGPDGAPVLREADGTPLPLSVPEPGPHGAIHGSGWRNAWEVEAGENDALRFRLERANETLPFRGAVTYRLRPPRGAGEGPHLEATLRVENAARRPLPFGVGFHPWFPRGDGARARLRAAGALELGERYRPRGPAPVPGFLAGGDVLPDEEVAVALHGWDGTATIRCAASGDALRVEASPTLRSAVLWSPRGADFLCFEPQSHALGAASEAAAAALAPLATLEPGEALEGTMRIVAPE